MITAQVYINTKFVNAMLQDVNCNAVTTATTVYYVCV